MTEPVVDPIWGTEHAKEVTRLCEELRSIGCVVAVWSAEDIQERYRVMRVDLEWRMNEEMVTSDDLDVPPTVYDITLERAQEILDLHKAAILEDAAEAGEGHLDYNLKGDPREEKADV